MKLLILTVLLTGISASAGRKTYLPFDPAYAHLQKNITFESLGQEVSQFMQLVNWHGAVGNVDSRKRDLEFHRRSYERALKLKNEGRLTEEEFADREYKFHLSETKLAEAESQTQMVRLSAETARLGLIQNGDENLDMRREIAQKMKESLEFRKQSLEQHRQGAILTETNLRGRYERAKELFEKGIVPVQEFERHELNFQNAQTDLQVVDGQIQVINAAILGFNKSLDRLF
ncbi:MAG: hypothetical protein AB7F86_15910 [Bdellovibrionales bacterium]